MTELNPNAWDEAAAAFDQPADHGLQDPDVRSAWRALLTRVLPAAPSRVADLGCGTGSLTLLAAELGHEVDGIDFSEKMLGLAAAKAAGRKSVTFAQGNATHPSLADRAYDAVLCRHVLWALPDPASALHAWSRLLRPLGRLVLIEGRWSTGAGLPAEATTALLRQCGYAVTTERLDDPQYWGREISDERYVAVGRAVLA